MNDAVDSALDSDDIEDEIEEEVDKVLTAIAGEIATQLPQAVRKERVKHPAHGVRAAEEVCVSPNLSCYFLALIVANGVVSSSCRKRVELRVPMMRKNWKKKRRGLPKLGPSLSF